MTTTHATTTVTAVTVIAGAAADLTTIANGTTGGNPRLPVGNTITPHARSAAVRVTTRGRRSRIRAARIPAGEIKTAWEAAKARAGVECRFHDLRHTACTRLLERGASLPIVASIMGWSASTTAKMAKRYGHIGADVQRAALDALTETPPPRGQAGNSKQLPEPDSGLNV